ncbi:ubiquinone/menaquinone biosynthesis C-methyltransferase UbiE [Sulfurimicrobium lacus]|uniref:Ubiquinone/menaquinone biosynthesis C-methyltransferase UbiE n=1 Tax=Sulfurimicrobium lacus TaxID=2715678 RepID=A0A6F8V9B8_9PROT|nr:class I SAM-dependent methyltransferase [Sulfurimicrobium lacus]BCB26254.1 ubiquinone/menaquinone biosynthesis C-methyltransferase UbiE [Sulfurimicrobium lacus]
MTDLSRTFGYQSVAEDERTRRIRRVFSSVAPRYDLMNDLMSMGIHRLWKRSLARQAAALPGQVVVDLAGGTGDVAALMAGKGAQVMVCDPSLAMMNAGRADKPSAVMWLAGTGERIPLAAGSVDTVTIAFGIRNVTSLENAMKEVLRVLKPGGRFLCLEFSRPWAPIKPFYDVFSFTVIPRLGAWIARDPEAYTYLVESIRRFPDQEEMRGIMEQAGFAQVRYRNLSFGIACLHSGVKPL